MNIEIVNMSYEKIQRNKYIKDSKKLLTQERKSRIKTFLTMVSLRLIHSRICTVMEINELMNDSSLNENITFVHPLFKHSFTNLFYFIDLIIYNATANINNDGLLIT